MTDKLTLMEFTCCSFCHLINLVPKTVGFIGEGAGRRGIYYEQYIFSLHSLCTVFQRNPTLRKDVASLCILLYITTEVMAKMQA